MSPRARSHPTTGTSSIARVDALRAAGAQVEESHPAVGFREQANLWFALVSAASAPGLPEEIRAAAAGSHLDWLRNRERRHELRQLWHAWFEDHDALLCPVTLSGAPEHKLEGEWMQRTIDIEGIPRSLTLDIPVWCGLFNVIGFPSCVVPIGRTDAGLPVGVQIITASFRDREALHLRALHGDDRRPIRTTTDRVARRVQAALTVVIVAL